MMATRSPGSTPRCCNPRATARERSASAAIAQPDIVVATLGDHDMRAIAVSVRVPVQHLGQRRRIDRGGFGRRFAEWWRHGQAGGRRQPRPHVPAPRARRAASRPRCSSRAGKLTANARSTRNSSSARDRLSKPQSRPSDRSSASRRPARGCRLSSRARSWAMVSSTAACCSVRADSDWLIHGLRVPTRESAAHGSAPARRPVGRGRRGKARLRPPAPAADCGLSR